MVRWWVRYVREEEVEEYRDQGWTVTFHKYYQDNRASFIAKKERDMTTEQDMDEINNPSHYTQGIECIDFIESQGLDKDHHLANAVKYIVRCRHKGNMDKDLRKALWYIERRLKLLNAE